MTDTPRRSLGELADTMGIEIVEYTDDRVAGTMPVAGNRQPFGLLHGGASAALSETLGSIHAHRLAPDGLVPVGTDLNCTHHRGLRDGVVSAVSTPLHVGRTVACFEIVVSDAAGRRICTARLSCAYIQPR